MSIADGEAHPDAMSAALNIAATGGPTQKNGLGQLVRHWNEVTSGAASIDDAFFEIPSSPEGGIRVFVRAFSHRHGGVEGGVMACVAQKGSLRAMLAVVGMGPGTLHSSWPGAEADAVKQARTRFKDL